MRVFVNRFSNIFIKIREYRRDIMGDTSTTELFEKTLLWFLEKVRMYTYIRYSMYEQPVDVNIY